MSRLRSLAGAKVIPFGGVEYATDEDLEVDVPDELAGRPPSGVPFDEDYDPGEGLLAQTDSWAAIGAPRPHRPKVKDILEAVGGDPELATQALETELASDDPRSTLIEQLNAIINGGEG